MACRSTVAARTVAAPLWWTPCGCPLKKTRKQPIAAVIMGAPLRQARPHRQQGLRAAQRLDLGFLIHTEHDRIRGRVQAELDARRLYLGEGCSSLFTYCTQALRLSEHAAYGRIEAARIARKFPVVIDLLAEGAMTLTTITLLGPMLTPDNHQQVLAEARHQSKREVEHLCGAVTSAASCCGER